MNVFSMVKLGLLVMHTRGASSLADSFDLDSTNDQAFDIQEGYVLELFVLVNDPDAENNFEYIKSRMQQLFLQIYTNYKRIASFANPMKINTDMMRKQMGYIVSFKASNWNNIPQSIGEIRDASRFISSTFNTLREVIEAPKEVKALQEDMNNVREKISDLMFLWSQVNKYYAGVVSGENIVRDYDTLSDELQYRLLRSLDVLSKLESRIFAIQCTYPTSYGCMKAIELIGNEREYVATIYEHAKNLKGGGQYRSSFSIIEINKCMEQEHYLKDLNYIWKRFMDIMLGWVFKVDDVKSSYSL